MSSAHRAASALGARRVTALGLLVAVGCGGISGADTDATSTDRTPASSETLASPSPVAVHGASAASSLSSTRVFVSSVDETRGTPTFLWGPRSTVVRKPTTTPEL